jgi:hypothetical protein
MIRAVTGGGAVPSRRKAALTGTRHPFQPTTRYGLRNGPGGCLCGA